MATAAPGGGTALAAEAVGKEPSPSPETVQHLADLILGFPSAVTAGVRWEVLARKFEERHGFAPAPPSWANPSRSGLRVLPPPWDPLCVVDGSELRLGIQDAAAMVPRPGQLGCWPSLYQALCQSVLEHGSANEELLEASGGASCLLLSQLRKHIDRQWHASFDESVLGYFNDHGAFVRFKKLKHLLQALIVWRQQRQELQLKSGRRPTALDVALRPALSLVASSHFNDVLLQCSLDEAAPRVEKECPVVVGSRRQTDNPPRALAAPGPPPPPRSQPAAEALAAAVALAGAAAGEDGRVAPSPNDDRADRAQETAADTETPVLLAESAGADGEGKAWEELTTVTEAVSGDTVASSELWVSKQEAARALASRPTLAAGALAARAADAEAWLKEDARVPAADRFGGAAVAGEVGALRKEVQRLRLENEALRARNEALEQCGGSPTGNWVCVPMNYMRGQQRVPPDIFDDPFEPPPEEVLLPSRPGQFRAWAASDAAVSTECASTVSELDSFGLGSGLMPASPRTANGSQVQSGAATPGATLVPMWACLIPFGTPDVSIIPEGIVRSVRNHFERLRQQGV